MKQILLSLIFLASVNLYGQTLKLENEKFVLEKIDSVASLNKEDRYEKAKKWVVRNLKSSDSNVEFNDKDYEQITSTGNLSLDEIQNSITCVLTNVTLNFKFNVFFKEDRYKVVFDQMLLSNTTVCNQIDGSAPQKKYHEYPLEKLGLAKKKREKVLLEIEQKMLALCLDLNQNLNGINSQKGNDW